MLEKEFLHSLVPRMYKSELDDRARDFLDHYCKEALEKPMPVPIEEIAREKLHLSIKEYHLSEDLSILGQMCFTDGLVEIYDPMNDEYREIPVKARTMIIDPDTYLKRNFGSKRNTEAHECVHWVWHRKYHLAAYQYDKNHTAAFRCPIIPKDESSKSEWTDEDWMEWQANSLAPRILMPRETVGDAFQMVIDKSKQNPFVSAGLIQKGKWVIEQFAGFYQVSKLSAAIRLQELGYLS